MVEDPLELDREDPRAIGWLAVLEARLLPLLRVDPLPLSMGTLGRAISGAGPADLVLLGAGAGTPVPT